MKVEYINIDSIKEYKGNAKLHPREQIEQIKKSIEEFGMNDPIGIWNDEIVEGHGRYIACRELGYGEVPVIRLDHLSDEQRKAYTLVHNKLTMNSDFDINVLENELSGIIDIDMNDFGFDLVTGDEVDIEDLDDDRTKTKVNVSIVFDKYEDYLEIKEELDKLAKNGNLSIKMV